MKRETRYLGVDLHRNCFTVYTREADGSGESREWAIRRLAAFAKTVRATDAVAVEATGNVRLFCAALQGRGCRLVVVNPHQFEVISRSVKKTDEQDAKVLAEFLAKGLLPEVRMKDERAARIASLAQTRDKLVKLRTVLKNKVNNLLAARGILLDKESLGSEKGLAAVLQAPVSDLERLELDILVGEIRHLTESIKKVEGLLREQGPSLPGGRTSPASQASGPWGRASCSPRSATSPTSPARGSSRPTSGSSPGCTTRTPPRAVATSPNGARSSAARLWSSAR